ncbi:MAG TPA: SpoIIE family protein phosphatase [Acidimicrobiales bacterium]|nr:SpoIIE family protein phosphatase [Acidimicrobiales bacterium]
MTGGADGRPVESRRDPALADVSARGRAVRLRDSERLRRIESVTDAALTHLDVPDLLGELLERVREILDVDTAAVLLLDEATGDLVASAASGIEEEVRQRVRVPMGQGFAGRIAAEVRPVVIEDVEHSDVRNPILRERGIETLVGVPLVVESRVIGVLHVGTVTPRRFESDDVEFVQMVGDRVALAVEARRSNVERAAAAALQRSLIPDRLPGIPGLELAGRYLPAGAGGVGGDWYDVFVLPTGRVGVVMGDVLGRGLRAAVVMGRLRSALRAYALEATAPGEVLERLDRKLQHFEAGQMTTVLYATLDTDLAVLSLSSAGHPLPMMSTAGSGVVTVAADVDPPLGVDTGVRRRTTSLDVPPGAMLALFTDGLIERRGELITDGLERLRRSLRAGSAEQRCATAIHTMLGGDDPEDDVALLVIRREDSDDCPPLHITIPAVATSLVLVRTALRRWLSPLGVSERTAFDVMLAVGEAMANVVAHAYGPRGGTMDVDLSYSGGDIVATIRDTGRWRLPRGTNRGRGLNIMEKCAAEVVVDTTEGGTEVYLRFPGETS